MTRRPKRVAAAVGDGALVACVLRELLPLNPK